MTTAIVFIDDIAGLIPISVCANRSNAMHPALWMDAIVSVLSREPKRQLQDV